MSEDNFAVFILTHGRADNVITYKTLRKEGYTGKIYIVIDDEDDQEEKYRSNFGEEVVQFCKADYDDKFDIMDSDNDRRVVVYARNAIYDIAESLGYRDFCVLDDDYKDFQFRYAQGKKLKIKSCTNLDKLFSSMFKFLDVSNAKTVCLAQGGDFIGGVNSGTWQKGLLRKAMNVWFLRTDRKIEFIGRINEDTNTYVVGNIKGDLFLTIVQAMVVQTKTQENAGGLTDIYLASGTYRKSFYSVMCAPSCVSIAEMGDKHRRIHHHVSWNNCAPKILNEKWKKEG